MFQKSEDIKIEEMNKRKATANENISRIRTELAARIKADEKDWQLSTSKWLVVAKRKVEVKKREDEEARVGKLKRKIAITKPASTPRVTQSSRDPISSRALASSRDPISSRVVASSRDPTSSSEPISSRALTSSVDAISSLAVTRSEDPVAVDTAEESVENK